MWTVGQMSGEWGQMSNIGRRRRGPSARRWWVARSWGRDWECSLAGVDVLYVRGGGGGHRVVHHTGGGSCRGGVV